MKASDWNRIEAGIPKEGQLCLIRLKGSQIAVSAFEIVLDDKGGEFGAFAVDGSYYTIDFMAHPNLYDNIIDCIEWLINEDYFNKDYLEEKGYDKK